MYQTPKAPGQCELVIKKSRFLGFLYPVSDFEDVKAHIQALKDAHSDARHVCNAYIFGDPKNTTAAGFDDAGEPNGTAGRPILNVLMHKSLGDALLIVVRYFGGVKLGAGGLTRAYAACASKCVEATCLMPHIPKVRLTLVCSYPQEAHARRLIEDMGAVILDASHQTEVRLTLKVPKHKAQTFASALFGIGRLED